MDAKEIATNFGLPGLMMIAIYAIAKLWIASNERVQMERVKVDDKRADATVAALTSLSGKLDAHHTVDLQGHQELATGIARVEGKLDTLYEFTPVNQPVPSRKQTPASGVPAGYYPPQRPKTQGGGR